MFGQTTTLDASSENVVLDSTRLESASMLSFCTGVKVVSAHIFILVPGAGGVQRSNADFYYLSGTNKVKKIMTLGSYS